MTLSAQTFNPELLTHQIKQRALSEGFDNVGVVPAEALQPENDHLQEWLSRGYHGNMAWMAREPEKRTDPTRIFPGAKSIVVVTLNYYTSHEHECTAGTGKVSRYAWGDDYHDIVGDKLRSLLDWITSTVPGATGKVCVDIQPMMDKAWAVRAGLGWIGKHSNLITTEQGSWVFIGELLLNLELNYDSKHVDDHCGTCTLCIESCPTGAIVESYVVDSTRCISYATIELRDPEIPDTVAGNMQGWLYGCDICQDVCPWNRFEQPTKEERFQPRAGNVAIDLEEIMRLTPESYAERFRKSAMKRTKLSGIKRNALMLLNSEQTEVAV